LAAKVFLIVGLGVSAFVWLLAAQMRFMVMRVLELNANDKFPSADPADQKNGARAAAMGQPGEISDVLRETCAQAIGHYQLARKARFVAPAMALIVVAVWRFGFGGSV